MHIVKYWSYFDEENYPVFSHKLRASLGPLGIFMQELYTGASTPEEIIKEINKNFSADAKDRGLIVDER